MRRFRAEEPLRPYRVQTQVLLSTCYKWNTACNKVHDTFAKKTTSTCIRPVLSRT